MNARGLVTSSWSAPRRNSCSSPISAANPRFSAVQPMWRERQRPDDLAQCHALGSADARSLRRVGPKFRCSPDGSGMTRVDDP